jgi:hypothetical protein
LPRTVGNRVEDSENVENAAALVRFRLKTGNAVDILLLAIVVKAVVVVVHASEYAMDIEEPS